MVVVVMCVLLVLMLQFAARTTVGAQDAGHTCARLRWLLLPLLPHC